MGKFLWYSKDSEASGKALAQALELENGQHGPLPPKGFKGVCVSWGAKPTEKFKWGNRNFRALFNDPREVRKLKDRKIIFDKLAEAGINVISCMPLNEGVQYMNICNLMGVENQIGFVATRPNGTGARRVTSQAELQDAMGDGRTRAMEDKFTQSDKIRVYVVDGSVVAASRLSGVANEAFFNRAAAEIVQMPEAVVGADDLQAILKYATDGGILKPCKSYWAPFGAVTPAMRSSATLVAKTLGYSFCAVDVQLNNGQVEVLNVVTTPNLVDVPDALPAIANELAAWINRNSKTPKELLKELVDNANEDVAEELLEKLRELKREALVEGA